ncbi:hypothetical protein EV702DRAFT_1194931 [Suillus placidus]|uniref:Uncharacterized protein n=1 Tax=Suillus placidus TaxID=48579 RepID=A0A9P7D5R0_9AGAM|nr:hypothetical protein EV702DRAFT_1194931 [Suillus placidus]
MTSPAALRYFCGLVTTYAVPSVPCGGMASTSYSTPFSETVTQGLMELTAPQGHGGIVFPMDVFLIVSYAVSLQNNAAHAKDDITICQFLLHYSGIDPTPQINDWEAIDMDTVPHDRSTMRFPVIERTTGCVALTPGSVWPTPVPPISRKPNTGHGSFSTLMARVSGIRQSSNSFTSWMAWKF